MKKSLLRLGITATTVVVACYSVVVTANHFAAANTATGTAAASIVARSDTTVELPAGSVADVLVDDLHQQVFVSVPSAGSVVVADLAGQVTGTVTGLANPGEMTLSDNGGTVYVVEQGTPSIGRLDTVSYTVDHTVLADTVCPTSVTTTGGRVWFSYQDCVSAEGKGTGIGGLDPAAGTVTTDVFSPGSAGMIRALPGRPDRLALLTQSLLAVYDVTGTPTAVSEMGFDGSDRTNCRDAGLAAGGDLLVTACGAPYHHEAFSTADLTAPAAVIDSTGYPNAVAISDDGRYVAVGSYAPYQDDIYVRNLSNGVPGSPVRTYDFGSGTGLAVNALDFTAGGDLVAVTEPTSGNSELRILAEAAKIPSAVALEAPQVVEYQGAVTVKGVLRDGPGIATTVNVLRRDRTGEHDLGAVPVNSDGSFDFIDQPQVTGQVAYAVAWAGDDTHSASGTKVVTTVRPLPFDVNGDGYADVVGGSPGEDLGSAGDAGMFHLLYGSTTGTTGTGSVGIHQDTAGVPGSAESGDGFGYSSASGDFNGDGYADVAVSAGAENIGTATDGGGIWIFYGSATGLRTDNVSDLTIADTVWTGRDYTYLGDALAAGDFDGDGRDDLAIGAAPTDEVVIAKGTVDGLSDTDLRYFSQSTDGVPGTRHDGELFGWSLTAGDVSGDGRDDLAVGAIYDWDDLGWSTGSVTMLYGGADGLTGTGAQRWSKDTTGVPGSGGSFDPEIDDDSDLFGYQVVLADINGDGKADLATAAPGAPVTVDGVRKRDAGTLTVLYAGDGAISSAGAVEVSQQDTGMPGVAGQEDHLGVTLAGGDVNGDGAAELALYSDGDGYVTVIPGGLLFESAQGWTQNSDGIPGASEPGDEWGNSLRFADVAGTGMASLVVGADGENTAQGAFTVIPGTSTGLTGVGSRYFSQNTAGVPGTAENGDRFGAFY